MIIGSNTIMMIVKMIEIEMATERSSFFAPDAAPVAIAADVPQTDVAAATVIRSGLFLILRILFPNHHMKMMTTGVTPQAMPRP